MLRSTILSALLVSGCGFSHQPARAQSPPTAVNPVNGEVTLVVDFEVKRGFEPEFERAFALSVRCSRLESGNVAFNIHKVDASEGRYVLYEIWRSPQALEAHFGQPYTKALFAMFDRALVTPVSEGGLRFIVEQNPAPRPAKEPANPMSLPECR